MNHNTDLVFAGLARWVRLACECDLRTFSLRVLRIKASIRKRVTTHPIAYNATDDVGVLSGSLPSGGSGM